MSQKDKLERTKSTNYIVPKEQTSMDEKYNNKEINNKKLNKEIRDKEEQISSSFRNKLDELKNKLNFNSNLSKIKNNSF